TAYRTLTAVGMGTDGRRGPLDHARFSGHAPGFPSAPAETRAALRPAGAAPVPPVAAATEVTGILDGGCDGVAVWAGVRGQGHRLVRRLRRRERPVRPPLPPP